MKPANTKAHGVRISPMRTALVACEPSLMFANTVCLPVSSQVGQT